LILFKLSRPDDFLLQTEMISREILRRGILPFGMASGRLPPSSMQRTSFFASGRTHRNLCIVKVPDGCSGASKSRTRALMHVNGRTLKASTEVTSRRTRRSFMTQMSVRPTGTSLEILLSPNVMTRFLTRFLSITCAAQRGPGVTSFPNRFAFTEHYSPELKDT